MTFGALRTLGAATRRAPEDPGDPREAVQRGLAILARRPRTQSDLRERLLRDFDAPAVDAALGRLAELGYVDDGAWARSYLERPRSLERGAALLRLELQRHGVPEVVAREALQAHDDGAASRRAAAKAMKRRVRGDQAGGDVEDRDEPQRRKLLDHLRRRGFGFELARAAVAALEGSE